MFAAARERLFVALPLPAPLVAALEPLRPSASAGVRPAMPADMHVTLHFLGDADVMAVRTALGTVRARAFHVGLRGPGRFALNGRRAVLYIAVEQLPALAELHLAVGRALAVTGFEPERRAYVPHVTLARLGPAAPLGLAERFLETPLPAAAAAGFDCDHFALYASRADAAGARYRIVETYGLSAAEPGAQQSRQGFPVSSRTFDSERDPPMGFTTKQVHAGVRPDPITGSILTPVFQTTTFVQESVDQYLAKGFSYSRSGNPTVAALEEKIAVLENGAACTCYATGMAAIQATIQATLSAGDHAIISDVAYGGTYRLCTTVYARYGVQFSFVDTSNPAAVRAAVRDNTKLILTETPANPTLKLTDIRAISDIARERGIVHAVDNTFLTPYYQRPLELGANASIHSTTKYFDGHNSTVGGAVVTDTPELNAKIRYVMNAAGVIMSPWVAWLTLQGTKTLSIRLDRQSANAQQIAEFLESHPKVTTVRYPGLASFPQHALAKSQASGFGAMLWFEVEGGVQAGKKLMDSVELCTLAENLGSVETLITHPVTMTHADVDAAERKRVGITDGLVRLSVGLEDVEDLIADLKTALDRI